MQMHTLLIGHFPGRRYGHFTSNICESLNAALLPAREMPILAMFEAIRKLLMNWFSEKRNSEDDSSEDSSGSEDVLLPGRTRKPSGRPRNKRIKPTKTREEKRRVKHCGR